jgi:D-arabinose 1-dehydrogenase-like Zn-dependent alcohol dehydrogenase
MTVLHRQSLTAYAAPLSATTSQCPQPRGTEVLVRIARCGVCHSDLHLQDGYFHLSDDKKLDVRSGRTLPFTLGHEIAGTVVAIGQAADGVKIGDAVAVYPWIGCGQCKACLRGEENICSAPRHLGVNMDGGFASHVLVPHPRYVLDASGLAPERAAIMMCSGLTAYAALKRLEREASLGPLLLVGMGGVGMMGLALAIAMFKEPPFVADIDATKREAAVAAGAAAAFDPAADGARRTLLAQSGGGVYGACDFAGSTQSLAFATGALAKGGKVVVTGLLGGTLSMPTAMLGLKAMAIEGTQTGTLAQACEVLELCREANFRFPPIRERPMTEAQAALDALRAGKVVGRLVLAA